MTYIITFARILKVHHSWLKAAQRGHDLPAEVPELTSSHLHWLMQPSCSNDRVPAGWHLVRVICVSKERISSRYKPLNVYSA